MIDQQKYLTRGKKVQKYIGFQWDDDRQKTVVDKWDLHNGEYITLPVSCEFNVGTPSLALVLKDFSSPSWRWKASVWPIVSIDFLLVFFFKDQTKHRSHNNSANSACHLCLLQNWSSSRHFGRHFGSGYHVLSNDKSSHFQGYLRNLRLGLQFLSNKTQQQMLFNSVNIYIKNIHLYLWVV